MSHGIPLSAIVASADHLRELPKDSLRDGDVVLVRTSNSLYTIRILEDGYCKVSGGWFDRKGLSPATTRIAGCSWGGSAIKINIAAACGLRLEFVNRLRTTPIELIVHFPRWQTN